VGIRPIDLQILLKQMGEVSKKENQRLRKKDEDKKVVDDRIRDKRGPGGEDATHIHEAEAAAEVQGEHPRVEGRGRRKKNKKETDASGEKKDEGLKGDFQGNFLDITE